MSNLDTDRTGDGGATEALVKIRRSDADIIRRLMEEFWRRKELSPEEGSAFLSLCDAGDFGRPVQT